MHSMTSFIGSEAIYRVGYTHKWSKILVHDGNENKFRIVIGVGGGRGPWVQENDAMASTLYVCQLIPRDG